MKRIIALLTFVSCTAIADSITIQYQTADVLGKPDQQQYSLNYNHSLSKNLTNDISISSVTVDGTGALSNRIEAGVTSSYPVIDKFVFYTRVAAGNKITNTKATSYYVIEPGVQLPVGSFTARVGYRYRDSFDDKNKDQTNTIRFGLRYRIDKTDALSVTYDRMRKDSIQNAWSFGYTKTF
jgi:hypothetical protein